MKTKRLLTLLLALSFLFLPMTAFSVGSGIEATPDYVIYCEGSQYQGRHDAKANGWGNVTCTTNSSLSFSGVAFQCTKCYQLIITENEPALGIGKYGEWNPGYSVGYFTNMRVSQVKSTSGTTLPAYRFRYS